MSFKWRLWCDVHGWVYDWSDTPITQCPINNSDTVDTSKTFQVGNERAITEVIPRVYRTRSGYYSTVASIIYDTDSRGPLHRIKFLGYMQSGVTSYNVEIYDRTNEVSLSQTEFSNTDRTIENSTDVIENSPEGKVIIDINIKRTSSSRLNYAYILGVTLFSRRNS